MAATASATHRWYIANDDANDPLSCGRLLSREREASEEGGGFGRARISGKRSRWEKDCRRDRASDFPEFFQPGRTRRRCSIGEWSPFVVAITRSCKHRCDVADKKGNFADEIRGMNTRMNALRAINSAVMRFFEDFDQCSIGKFIYLSDNALERVLQSYVFFSKVPVERGNYSSVNFDII